jgi:peptidoglycan/LPS O-acetylase OafA/YrhL
MARFASRIGYNQRGLQYIAADNIHCLNPIGKKYQSSLAGIDLLRFLLSLVVVVFHYRMLLRPYSGGVKVPSSKLPLDSVLEFVYEHGGYAVEIFWLISGFIFYRIYAGAIATKKVRFREFSLLRFSRLYPLHILTLLLVASFEYVYYAKHGAYYAYPNNNIASFTRQLFLVSHWGDYGLSFNGPVWSVSVEIFVYLVFFIACVAGLLKGKRIFIVMAIAALCYLLHFPKPFFECIYYFFSGCLLSYLYNRHTPLRLLTVYVFTGLLFGAITVFGHIGEPVYDMLRTTTGIIASSLILLGFIYAFGRLQNKHSLYLMKSCGDITYSMYLIHFPVQLIATLLINPQNDSLFQSTITFVVYILVIIIMGRIVYSLYEKPVQVWLREKLL